MIYIADEEFISQSYRWYNLYLDISIYDDEYSDSYYIDNVIISGCDVMDDGEYNELYYTYEDVSEQTQSSICGFHSYLCEEVKGFVIIVNCVNKNNENDSQAIYLSLDKTELELILDNCQY